MKVTISKGKVSGEVIAPPSKSFAHRQLICSALSGKKCTVKGIVDSEDMLATLDCLKALGYTYRKTENQVEFLGERVDSTSVFNCRESGSTLRFMLPVSLCFCDDATFLGSEKLISRGIGIYQQIFGEKGVKLTVGKDCVKTHGRLKSGDYKIMGNLSSQFVTGMFFALPLLR
ncbi:MAG: 3-phosphoshikimate 1-carboxyvinyltransferase, partial [Clostridia bacterium]|nr:3-phosphoshikimate 1-carboxyvinyltransferase [Clostridia bacterium]